MPTDDRDLALVLLVHVISDKLSEASDSLSIRKISLATAVHDFSNTLSRYESTFGCHSHNASAETSKIVNLIETSGLKDVMSISFGSLPEIVILAPSETVHSTLLSVILEASMEHGRTLVRQLQGLKNEYHDLITKSKIDDLSPVVTEQLADAQRLELQNLDVKESGQNIHLEKAAKMVEESNVINHDMSSVSPLERRKSTSIDTEAVSSSADAVSARSSSIPVTQIADSVDDHFESKLEKSGYAEIVPVKASLTPLIEHSTMARSPSSEKNHEPNEKDSHQRLLKNKLNETPLEAAEYKLVSPDEIQKSKTLTKEELEQSCEDKIESIESSAVKIQDAFKNFESTPEHNITGTGSVLNVLENCENKPTEVAKIAKSSASSIIMNDDDDDKQDRRLQVKDDMDKSDCFESRNLGKSKSADDNHLKGNENGKIAKNQKLDSSHIRQASVSGTESLLGEDMDHANTDIEFAEIKDTTEPPLSAPLPASSINDEDDMTEKVEKAKEQKEKSQSSLVPHRKRKLDESTSDSIEHEVKKPRAGAGRRKSTVADSLEKPSLTAAQKYKRFQTIAINLIKSIEAHRFSSPFLAAVTALEYKKVIKHPKDLKSILKAVKKKQDQAIYTTVKELERDIILMFTNCVMFNKFQAPLVQMAREMKDDVRNTFKMFEEAESGLS